MNHSINKSNQGTNTNRNHADQTGNPVNFAKIGLFFSVPTLLAIIAAAASFYIVNNNSFSYLTRFFDCLIPMELNLNCLTNKRNPGSHDSVLYLNIYTQLFVCVIWPLVFVKLNKNEIASTYSLSICLFLVIISCIPFLYLHYLTVFTTMRFEAFGAIIFFIMPVILVIYGLVAVTILAFKMFRQKAA